MSTQSKKPKGPGRKRLNSGCLLLTALITLVLSTPAWAEFGTATHLVTNDATSASQLILFRADMDGDGAEDLVFTGKENTLYWSKANGDGTMAEAKVIFSMPDYTGRVSFSPPADMDNDGDLDIALSHGEYTVLENEEEVEYYGRILWLENDLADTGNWTEHTVRAYTQDTGRIHVAAFDPDNSGIFDIAYTIESLQQTGEEEPYTLFYIADNNGYGTAFNQTLIHKHTTTEAYAWDSRRGMHFLNMIATDYNNDGYMDIVMNIAVPETTNGTGRLMPMEDNCGLWENHSGTMEFSDGWFSGVRIGVGQFHLSGMELPDLNHDGSFDYLLTGIKDRDDEAYNTSGTLVVQLSGSTYDNVVEIDTGYPFLWARAADLNGDGKIDIVAAIGGHGEDGLHDSVVWYEGLGLGTWSDTPQVIQEGASGDVLIRDINDDGAPDLILGQGQSGDIVQYINTLPQGSPMIFGSFDEFPGTFPEVDTYLGHTVWEVKTADFNGDGAEDMIVRFSSDLIIYYPNDGSGNFNHGTAQVLFEGYSGNNDNDKGNLCAPSDMDGDGDLDIVLSISGNTSGESGAIFWFKNDLAAGNPWTKLTVHEFNADTPAGMIKTTVGDFNKDNKVDILAMHGETEESAVNFSVFTHNAAGPVYPWTMETLSYVFQPSDEGWPYIELGLLDAHDINEDGNLDIVFSVIDGMFAKTQYISYLPADDNASFAETPVQILQKTASYGTTYSLQITDINDDDSADLVINEVTNTSAALSFLPGAGNGTFGAETALGKAGGSQVAYSNYAFTDINNDGHTDLIRAKRGKDPRNKWGKGYIVLHRGTEQGFEDQERTLYYGNLYYSGGPASDLSTITALTLRDLNADGKQDIITGTKSGIGIIGALTEPVSIAAEDLDQDPEAIGGNALTFTFDSEINKLTLSGTLDYHTSSNGEEVPGEDGYYIGVAIKKPETAGDDPVEVKTYSSDNTRTTRTDGQYLLYYFKYDSDPDKLSHFINIKWTHYLPPVRLHIDTAKLSRTSVFVGKVFTTVTGAKTPVIGCTVTLEKNGVKTTLTTDENGNFLLKDVDSGFYTLTYTKDGFKTVTVENFYVEPGIGATEDDAKLIIDNTGSSDPVLYGDANQDGSVDALDAATVLQILSTPEEGSE